MPSCYPLTPSGGQDFGFLSQVQIQTSILVDDADWSIGEKFDRIHPSVFEIGPVLTDFQKNPTFEADKNQFLML